MRKFERWLSVLMCICMLCTSMLSPTQLVYAEEALVEAAEIIAEEEGVDAPESVGAEISDEAETVTPAEAEEPEAEPVMLAEAEEPEAEIAAAEVQDAEETKVPESGQSAESGETAEDGSGETEAETEITVEPIEKPDSIHPVVENTEEPAAQAFEFGYAKMTDDELLYEKYSDRTDEIGEVKRGGIVLVIAHRMEDDGSRARVQVNFACENEAVEGWLDAGSIEPLTEEEIEAFIEEIDEKAAEDETFVNVFYQGNEDFPLPVPTFEPAETETAAASQAVMTLSAESVEIRIGETAAILPVFSDGVSREVSYAVEPEGIAAVDEAGIVSALSVGETTITVFCAELNASASAQVKVVEASTPAQITVEPASLEMLVGDAVKLAYTLSEGAEGAVEFALSAENIVSVDAEGNVVAIGEGSCVITASLVSGGEPLASAQVPVNVYALTNGIQISAQDEADVGDAVVLSVDVPDAFKSRIEYSSSDENIASVGEDGVVSAKAPGVCTLTVSLGDVKAEHVLTVYDAPEDFEFTVSDAVLNVGETAQLSVVLPEFTRGDATYAVSNPLAVGVDAKGLVMAIGPGKCEVTATVAGVSKSLTVEVYGAPTELPLKLESDTLVVGYHMQAAVELSEYVIADVVISSSNTDVAWVDENGVVTAVAPGTCEIIAKSGSLTKSCGLTVVSSALELNTKYIDLAVGESFTLNYKITEEVLASETPVFSSSNESAVSVDPVSGAVEAVGEGKAVINVLLNKSGVTAQCFVSVHKAPTTILVIDAHTTVGVGQITPPIDYLLMAGSDSTIGSVTFSSSNPSVLQVNTRGQMKGIRAGTATVSIIAFNKASVDFKVTVLNAPTRLTLGAAAMTLAVGQSGKISYSLNSKTAAGMTFISSDESVATVDPKGNVTATGVGKATITVSTHNGLQKTCTINVSKAPENVTLKQTEFRLGVDMTAAVSPVVDTSSDVKFTYEFWTDAPDIISLNEKTGEIKALSVGTANVFVRAYNGVSTHEAEGERVATAAVVNVVPKPDHVTIDGTEFNIIAGKIIKLPVKMTMENGSEDCLTTYTLSSSSTKYVAVNSAGQVKGVKAGSATVTLTAGNGDVVTCKVVVRAAPRKVVLNKSSIVLGEGMKNAELAVRVYYSSSKYFTYSYEDSLGTG
ncbi:MAG: Ig-like domain-containing protein, partial [Clostridia bacterium]|nr:Ig-like domain-containing protein [Clostridia bacterium]